jgi:hypothetical protein
MFLFDGKRIVQDLLSKALQVLGGSAIAGGYVTGDEWTAIGGGLAAAVGVLVNMFTNRKVRQNLAITAAAVHDNVSPIDTAKAVEKANASVALPTDKATEPKYAHTTEPARTQSTRPTTPARRR